MCLLGSTQERGGLADSITALPVLAIKFDDLLGYGKPNYKNKWWYDLEEVDGKMIMHSPNKKLQKDYREGEDY